MPLLCLKTSRWASECIVSLSAAILVGRVREQGSHKAPYTFDTMLKESSLNGGIKAWDQNSWNFCLKAQYNKNVYKRLFG